MNLSLLLLLLLQICDEFYRQGDYERQLSLPVTPLCDRSVMSVARIQTGMFFSSTKGGFILVLAVYVVL